LEPAYCRAPLWRELKARILELADSQRMLPVWILEEAHHLPAEFFRDLPDFLIPVLSSSKGSPSMLRS
jgi:MSHA biogenesis protein MshM